MTLAQKSPSSQRKKNKKPNENEKMSTKQLASGTADEYIFDDRPSLLVGTRASRRELDASDKMEMPSLEEHGDWLYPNEPKYQPLEMEEIDTTDKKGKKFKQPNLWQQQLDKMKEETSYNRQSRLADVNYQRHFAFNQPIVPFCCSCCCCQSMSLSYYYCPYIRPAVYQKVVAPKPITPKKSRRHDSQTN